MRKIVPPGQSAGLAPLPGTGGLGGPAPAPFPGAAGGGAAPRPFGGGLGGLGGLRPPGAAPVAGLGAPRQAMSPQAFTAYEESKDILAVAQKEAERIRQEAEGQRDQQMRAGYEEGYRKGYEEALKGLAKVEQQYQDTMSRLEPQLVQLSIAVAEKIIGEEMALRPQAIVDIVAQALKTVRHQKEIVVRVHPSRAQALEAEKQKLLGVLTRAHDVRVVADETLREGGCVVETEVGRLDADVDNQLAALRKALTNV